MKLLYYTNIPAPYFVAYVNELGKYADVTAIFEKRSFAHRDASWKKVNAEHFRYHFLLGVSISRELIVDSKAARHIKENPDAIVVIASPLTPVGMQCIEYCRRHKRAYVIQSEGGIPKDGKGLKEQIKRYFLKDAPLYLSGMRAKNDYFTFYGADPARIRTYPFSSLHESDLISQLPSREEKEGIKGELGIREKKNILFVGSMIHRKGIDVLIRACQGLGDEVGVYLVGGEAVEPFISLAKEQKVTNLHYIPFAGLATLRKYYLASDLFVLPTREDTWGLVINEAMSYGLPVITTRNCVAGVQLIVDGENGYLIDSEDSAALRRRMDQLLADEDLREKMGRNNLKKMQGYTYQNMAKTIYSYLCEAEKTVFNR